MKSCVCLLVSIIMLVMLQTVAFAQENESGEEFRKIADELGTQLEQGLDSDTADELYEDGIDLKDPESVSQIEAGDIFDKIKEAFSLNLKDAVKMIGKITALILIITVIKNYVTESFFASNVYSSVSVVCASTVIMELLTESMQAVMNAVNGINTFMMSYVPVYASLIITSGSPAAGTAYYVVLFSLCEIITLVASRLIIPSMSIVTALSIAGAINPTFSFDKISRGVKKVILWILGVLMTVMIAVLSVQSIIGISGDTVAGKAVKFAVSSFVPFVGGAVSDAYSTVKSSLGIIRSGIGGFGIIVILYIAIKPIASVAVIKLAVSACEVIADMFDEKSIASLMSSLSSVISVCLSTIVCVSVGFILSTALLMLAGVNLT